VKILILALAALILAHRAVAGEENAASKVLGKPFPFRGWQGCYRLANGETEVVIVPAAGARVVVFAWKGKNVLYVDGAVDGKKLKEGENWMPWDGSAPDTVSPTGGSQLEHIWLGEYAVSEAAALRLKCVSKDNRKAGLRMEKEFVLDPEKPMLTIKRTITNLSDKPAAWSFWERTLVPGGGVAVAPVNPRSAYAPVGWASREKEKAEPPIEKYRYGPGTPLQGNPEIADGLLLVRSAGDGAGVGLDGDQGWTGAVVGDLFFSIAFPVWADKTHPWGKGINNVFYFAANRFELEPVSPYLQIGPGEKAAWEIQWRLSSFGKVPEDGKALAARVKELVRAEK
jgi:hypothetical protein